MIPFPVETRSPGTLGRFAGILAHSGGGEGVFSLFPHFHLFKNVRYFTGFGCQQEERPQTTPLLLTAVLVDRSSALRGKDPHLTLCGWGPGHVPWTAASPASLTLLCLMPKTGRIVWGQWGPLCPPTHCHHPVGLSTPLPLMCFQSGRPAPGSPRVAPGVPSHCGLELGWDVSVEQVLLAGRGCCGQGEDAVRGQQLWRTWLERKPGTAPRGVGARQGEQRLA